MKAQLLSWLLATMAPTIVFFGLMMLFGFRRRRGYSLLTQFPFEMIEGGDWTARILFYLYAVCEALCGGYMLFTNDLHPQLLPFSILYMVLMVLKAIAFAAMVSVPAYEFKPHIFSFTFFGALNVLSIALSTILLANLIGANQPLALAFAILVGLVGLGSLALLVNPRLAHWTELKSTVESDGTVTTSRPRPFVLAFTEWLMILFSLAGTLLALLGFALIGLSQV